MLLPESVESYIRHRLLPWVYPAFKYGTPKTQVDVYSERELRSRVMMAWLRVKRMEPKEGESDMRFEVRVARRICKAVGVPFTR